MIAKNGLFISILFTAILATFLQQDAIVAGLPDESCQTAADSCARGKELNRIERATMATKILLCDFEVFGIVQGVFFRKYTQKQASSLGVRGWCMNTHDGTVKGQLEGEERPLNEMKHWLQMKGSPSSRVDKAVFTVPKEMTSYTFKDFSIRR